MSEPNPLNPPRGDRTPGEPIPGDLALVEATLERMVGRVARHPAFLAAVFDRYASAGGPAADDLPGHLGLSRRAFLRFALNGRPRATSFEADVRRLAAAVGADPYRLAAVVRFADAAEAMAGVTVAAAEAADEGPNAMPRAGVLAAARRRAGRPLRGASTAGDQAGGPGAGDGGDDGDRVDHPGGPP